MPPQNKNPGPYRYDFIFLCPCELLILMHQLTTFLLMVFIVQCRKICQVTSCIHTNRAWSHVWGNIDCNCWSRHSSPSKAPGFKLRVIYMFYCFWTVVLLKLLLLLWLIIINMELKQAECFSLCNVLRSFLSNQLFL